LVFRRLFEATTKRLDRDHFPAFTREPVPLQPVIRHLEILSQPAADPGHLPLWLKFFFHNPFLYVFGRTIGAVAQ